MHMGATNAPPQETIIIARPVQGINFQPPDGIWILNARWKKEPLQRTKRHTCAIARRR